MLPKYANSVNDEAFRTPEQLTDRELLKQQFYLRQFLSHLHSSTNLPTLSSPQLLVNIQRQNERLHRQLQTARQGKRQQMLKKRLEALGKDAEGVMLRMKQFKAIREQEKNTLRELTKRAASTKNPNSTPGASTTS